ncbi:dynein light chain 1 cytoplasmic, partial [Clonorchis sinensis]
MTLNRAVVQNYDMPNEMQEDAVRMAIDAVQRYSVPKDIAAHLKREFDRKYEPAWHCVVGREFGRNVVVCKEFARTADRNNNSRRFFCLAITYALPVQLMLNKIVNMVRPTNRTSLTYTYISGEKQPSIRRCTTRYPK